MGKGGRRDFLTTLGGVTVAGLAGCTSGAADESTPSGVDPVREADATVVVETLDGLLGALESASAGDVVYVPPDVRLNTGGVWKVPIPDGVTLAGGRGVDGADGALLKSPKGDEGPEDEKFHKKFRLGRGARFTGFRLLGHHFEYRNAEEEFDSDYYAHRGGGVRANVDAVVDNNEIGGWPHAAVWAERNAHVHHNDLHHNTWEGLGYGVVVPGGDHMPVIEHNYFNYNRHAIAASGGTDCGYVARYNVVGPDWVGHQFDMHGSEGMTGIAGDAIFMHHNTFEGTHAIEGKTRNPGGEHPAIHIRGEPTQGVWVQHNWFYHDDLEGAYEQADGAGNAFIRDNHYGEDEPSDPDVGGPRSLSGGVYE